MKTFIATNHKNNETREFKAQDLNDAKAWANMQSLNLKHWVLDYKDNVKAISPTNAPKTAKTNPQPTPTIIAPKQRRKRGPNKPKIAQVDGLPVKAALPFKAVVKRRTKAMMAVDRVNKARDILKNGGSINKQLLEDLKTLGHGSKLERVFAWMRKMESIKVSGNYTLESFKAQEGSKLRTETINKSLGIIKEILSTPMAA